MTMIKGQLRDNSPTSGPRVDEMLRSAGARRGRAAIRDQLGDEMFKGQHLNEASRQYEIARRIERGLA